MTKNPKFSQSNNVSSLSEKEDDNLNYYFIAGGLAAALFLYYNCYKPEIKPQTTEAVSRDIKPQTTEAVSRDIKPQNTDILNKDIKPQIKPYKQVSDDRLI